jgi:hypothetical protein
MRSKRNITYQICVLSAACGENCVKLDWSVSQNTPSDNVYNRIDSVKGELFNERSYAQNIHIVDLCAYSNISVMPGDMSE